MVDDIATRLPFTCDKCARRFGSANARKHHRSAAHPTDRQRRRREADQQRQRNSDDTPQWQFEIDRRND